MKAIFFLKAFASTSLSMTVWLVLALNSECFACFRFREPVKINHEKGHTSK